MITVSTVWLLYWIRNSGLIYISHVNYESCKSNHSKVYFSLSEISKLCVTLWTKFILHGSFTMSSNSQELLIGSIWIISHRIFTPFGCSLISYSTLQWRHNECAGVSNHQPHDCSLNRVFRHRSKKTSKLRVTGLCKGNSPVTSEFHAQMTSNAENFSIWWRHHDQFMWNINSFSSVLLRWHVIDFPSASKISMGCADKITQQCNNWVHNSCDIVYICSPFN